MAEEKLTYKSAFDELTKISNSIMSDDIDVDVLSEKVKRAMYLTNFCSERLKSVNDEISNIISNNKETF